MRVTLYQRRPQGANYSVERLFTDVRTSFPPGIDARVAVCRFPSRGIWRRIYDAIEAVFRQGEVNHITGDVHFLALLLHRKKTVLTILDLVSVHRLQGIRRSLFLFLWYRWPMKRSAMVTVISEATKEDLLRHVSVPPQKIRVVHCCVSDDFIYIQRIFNETKPVILQVGTKPNKNLQRVAEALRGVPCHLRIIGELPDQDARLLQLHEVDYSSVSGITDAELLEEYRRCDLLMFASTFEGFGLPIIEAQATGRPVITSDLPSMAEVAGGSACLADPFDVQSIRAGVIKIINDSRYRGNLIELGLENVKRFRAEAIAAQYADIYRELA